jgi:hypothetical protein
MTAASFAYIWLYADHTIGHVEPLHLAKELLLGALLPYRHSRRSRVERKAVDLDFAANADVLHLHPPKRERATFFILLILCSEAQKLVEA